MSLFLIPITLRIYQPFYHVFCWQRRKLRASMKILLLSVFLSVFFSVLFLLFFLPSDTTIANLQGLTHSNLSQSTDQVTLSNEHMNHLFCV